MPREDPLFSTPATPGAAALLHHEQEQRIARRRHDLRLARLASDATDDVPRTRRSRVRDRGAFIAHGLRLAH